MVNKKLSFINLLVDNFFACQQTSDIHLCRRKKLSSHYLVVFGGFDFINKDLTLHFKTSPMQYLSFILLPKIS